MARLGDETKGAKSSLHLWIQDQHRLGNGATHGAARGHRVCDRHARAGVDAGHGNCAANIRPAIGGGETGDVIERLSGGEGLQLPDLAGLVIHNRHIVQGHIARVADRSENING